MAWYKTGTVAINNGSTTVTGTGTAWVDNAETGEGILLPDGRTYEIAQVISNTQILLGRPYLGSNTSGQPFEILPFRGRVADITALASELLATFGPVRDGVGAGLFPDGSAAAPALRFSNDQDTGVYRAGDNLLAFATGGAARMVVSTAGNVGIGTTNPGSYRLNVLRGDQGNVAQFTDGVESTFIIRTESGLLQAGQANNLPLALLTNSTERMRINASGSVGIGTTNPQTLFVVSNGGANGVEIDPASGFITTYNRSTNTWSKMTARASEYTFNIAGSFNALNISTAGRVGVGLSPTFAPLEVAGSMQVLTSGSNVAGGQIYFGNGDFQSTNFWSSAPGIGGIIPPGSSAVSSSAALGLYAYGGSANARTLVAWCGHTGTPGVQLSPGTDNTVSLGVGSFRWSTVFSATGSINTSDEREKHWRGGLSADELRAAKRIIGELGIYQWNDAVEEKGEDGARLHFGVRAQRAFTIMEEEGLDWARYAWCCYDQWDEATEVVLDEAGEPTDNTHVVRAAGDRYGIRPDQLAFWLIAAQAAIQSELEARIAALEAA